MSIVTVLRPDTEVDAAPFVGYADRHPVEEGSLLVLIENGKPRARDLMQMVAERLQQRFPIAEVEVFSKASAGKPIEAEEAKEMAARAHLVITGVGD